MKKYPVVFKLLVSDGLWLDISFITDFVHAFISLLLTVVYSTQILFEKSALFLNVFYPFITTGIKVFYTEFFIYFKYFFLYKNILQYGNIVGSNIFEWFDSHSFSVIKVRCARIFLLTAIFVAIEEMASCMDKINVVLWIKCAFENPDLVIPDFSNLLIKLTFMSSDFLVAT